MTLRITIITLLMTVFTASTSFSQHFHEDDIMTREGFNKAFPHLAEKADSSTQELERWSQWYVANAQHDGSRSSADYIIPVVFHILHENGRENLSDMVIHDAMRVLNEDFQKLNADTASVVPAFVSRIGNPKIEFRLATKDPDGKPTTGINRIETNLTNNAGENSKIVTWPRNTYLNVWVVKSIGSGAAGYTFLPGTANWRPQTDGIILLSNYLGSIRTGSYRRSRTLTHEVGHWLNLPHPWGGSNNPGLASNCQTDDGVWDTPNTIGWTSCNLSGTSCGSLDNVQNYMDYSYCSNMFTTNQAYRMQATLHNRTAQRDQLVSTTNNRNAGVLNLSTVAIEADQRVVCVGQAVKFEDKSFYDVTGWNWEFEGANISTSNLKDPEVEFEKPGLYSVKLTVNQSGGEKLSRTFNSYIRVNPTVGQWLPFSETFNADVDYANWIIENEDNDEVSWRVDKGGFGYSGPGYLRLDNYSNQYLQEESIIAPPVDISNISNPTLEFYVSTATRAAVSNDILIVSVSADCGQTWNIKYNGATFTLANGKQSQSAFYPRNASDWERVSISSFSPNERVENLLVKFTVRNGEGNNFFIDDINFTGSYEDQPVLEFPRNRMDSVAGNVYLDWKPVPFSDRYEYQLATDPGLGDIVLSGSNEYLGTDPYLEDTRALAEGLIGGRTYYWRVRSVRGSLVSTWSDTWSFTVSGNGVGHEFLDGEPRGFNTGVEALKNSFDYKIYPNPTTGNVRLNVSMVDNTALNVEIHDVNGRTVYSQVFVPTDNELNTILPSNEFEKGIYLVSVKSNDIRVIKRLIVQ